MSTIKVNNAARSYKDFQNEQEIKRVSDRSMADILADKLAQSEKTGSGKAESETGVSGENVPVPKDMSLAEYIHYIDQKISGISGCSYYRQDFIFIFISEEGYRAMQRDPEYEEWVLRQVKEAYAGCGYWSSFRGKYHCVKIFGATKEDCRSESWYSASRDEQNREWERRMLRKKRLKALLKKRLEKKRLEKAAYDKLILERRLEHQRMLASYQKEFMIMRSQESLEKNRAAIWRKNPQKEGWCILRTLQ